MAPGYSPYDNMNNTGVAKMLAQQHSEMQKAAASAQIDRMAMDVRELRYKIDQIDHKIYTSTSSTRPYYMFEDHDDEPEPSVETRDYVPSPLFRWLCHLFDDPIWEFFKRPHIK